MNQCRVCKRERGNFKLIKYASRHYAHADCLIRRHGIGILHTLPLHILKYEFPVAALPRENIEALKSVIADRTGGQQ